MVGPVGFEPTTRPLCAVGSNQLSYRPQPWDISGIPCPPINLSAAVILPPCRAIIVSILRRNHYEIRPSGRPDPGDWPLARPGPVSPRTLTMSGQGEVRAAPDSVTLEPAAIASPVAVKVDFDAPEPN